MVVQSGCGFITGEGTVAATTFVMASSESLSPTAVVGDGWS